MYSMTMHNQTKINQLLQNWPQGTVAIPSWLEKQEISRSLQEHYQKSNWIESIGNGAFKRTGDDIGWKGGLYAIQKQAKLPIHVGGLTAVVLQGSGHYIRFKENIQLFGNSDTKAPLPRWFRNYKWEDKVQLYRTKFLPDNVALKEYEDKNFSITISSLERAILECLYLAPQHVDIVECYHIMEGLVGLRPDVFQELLEKCTSVKVKRLFLYMAEKANHAWLQFIDTKNIDLGSGKRSLVKHGFYNIKYQITLPKELENI
jgi:hypothetical protein